MKRKFISTMFLLSLMLASCVPSEEALHAAIVSTLASLPPVPTQTALPTYTAFPTYTVYPTYTIAPTQTPSVPTNTPEPTITPTQPFFVQTKQIGPIVDYLSSSSYTIELTITDVKWKNKDDWKEPKTTNTFVTIYLTAKNLGPGAITSFGAPSFQALDSNGVLTDYILLPSTEQTCRLEIVDLLPNAQLTGCVSFEVPKDGTINFIFAPYLYEGLVEGRYLSFPIR